MARSLLKQREQVPAINNALTPQHPIVAGIQPIELPDFTSENARINEPTVASIQNTELDLRIELGRTHINQHDEIKLSKGSVLPLDKSANDPADVFVNGRLIARGEIVVLNESICVRIAEIIVPKAA